MEKVSSFDMSSDEKALYLKKDQWCFDQEQVQDELFQLGVHARAYFSVYKPLYLFEVKNTSVLEVFRSVWVRDGGFSLFLFFEKFPSPWATKTKLVIHESLAWIVPAEWQELVYFYRMKSENVKKQSDVKKVIFSGYAHPDVISPAEFSDICKTQLSKKISCDWLVQDHSIKDELHSYQWRSFQVELLKTLFQTTTDCHTSSWNSFLESSHQENALIHLDPYRLMSGDSYAEFHFLSTGGVVLNTSQKDVDVLETRRLSASHFCEIHQTWSPEQKIKQLELTHQKTALRSFIEAEQSTLIGLEDRSFTLTGLHPSIARMLGDLARKN